MGKHEDKELDIIICLEKIAWDNFERRRTYEWKFNFSVWAALGALIGILLAKDAKIPPIEGCLILVPIAFALFIILGHTFWLYQLNKRHRLDKSIAIFYEEELKKKLDIKFANEIDSLKKSVRNDAWSSLVSVLVTLLIVTGALIILLFR
ncbi:MAG: hypothetical protein ACE5GV_15100 [Candidatus Scalindua sp.]